MVCRRGRGVVGSAGGGEGRRLLVCGVAGGTTATTGTGAEGTAPGGTVTHHGLRGVRQPRVQWRVVEVRPAHLTSGGHPRSGSC